jgi:hypothetical protein
MNILSAIFAGQSGFLKSTQSMAKRAEEIASNGPEDPKLAENLVGLQIDKAFATANTRTISISGRLLNEFVRESTKK